MKIFHPIPKQTYWTSPHKALPEPFVSVQVFVPSWEPFPRVREGYVIDDANGIPLKWFIPALREELDLYEPDAWAPFVEPETFDPEDLS